MKKFLAIIAIAGVFTACGNSSETETTEYDTSTMMQAPMPDTASSMMGDTSMRMRDSLIR